MAEQVWTAVDDYFAGLLVGEDPVLEAVRAANVEAGLPSIDVSPNQGKMLQVLARGARHVLEIGTLGGYSTILLARALPADGRLITLEAVPKHAEVARGNIARAGLAEVVQVREGQALETLPHLEGDPAVPFDLVFIDADKPNITEYFDWAVALSPPGSLIIVDNVVRGGTVIDAESTDPVVQGVRRFHEVLAGRRDVTASAVQTVGVKGYDGFTIASVH